ncbi:ImmA/IrrE family metallo-endopeptidase [Pectobacterium odoriferum]|uniref:ImmA/IrrE family metallo-endopeptidase n=1 Tax=Pectobacterium odoriferum TaxID=78398 RepID=UPI000CD1446F|nr:ImmA/IrrE family metallo-endopeptidase [Pectobacterium odoriferum]POD97065.1 hypothetical protein BVY06_07065 [Pectobacterium odoriferum]
MVFDDDDIFLGRYSSKNFSEFYSEYKIFIEKINSAPLETKKHFMLADGTYNFKKLAIIFNNDRKENGNILFKKLSKAKDIVVNLWLCKVQNKAKIFEMINIPPFQGLSEEKAREIIQLNYTEKSYLSIPSILINEGIILIYEESFPGLNLDGAVYKNHNGNPVISLSIRHNRLDNFWFTLSHELAHVILHHNQMDEVILDDLDDSEEYTQGREFEANKLAGDMLIPRRIWRSCPVKYTRSSHDIESFSEEVNIHPAIIAGRIRKERGNYTLFNDVIYKEDLRKELF